MSDYLKKLKDPRWIKCREEIKKRDNYKCRLCHEKEIQLEVHHIVYFRKREPWEYEDEYLVTLCEKCHNATRSINDDLRRMVLLAIRLWQLTEVYEERLRDVSKMAIEEKYDELSAIMKTMDLPELCFKWDNCNNDGIGRYPDTANQQTIYKRIDDQ